jgi:hypothetical protein
MIELVDEPMLTTSAPNSKGPYTSPFHADDLDQLEGDSFISSELMISQSQLLSPYTDMCTIWQDFPLKPLQYTAWDDLQLWSPAMSQQESMIVGHIE